MQFLTRRKSTPADDADLRMTLDEQIQKLPDKLRRVVVCCYVQGLTKRQTAQALNWAEGTVTSHLKEARELLKKRLGGRGFSEESLASVLSPVAVPALLHSATVNAGAAAVAGKIAAVASAKVLSMTKGTAKAMALVKLKLAAAIVVAAGIAVAGTAAVTQRAPASPQPTTQPAAMAPLPPNAPWGSANLSAMRQAVMSIQIYMNDHGGSMPPDLKSARVLNKFEYLGNPSVKSKMVSRPYALAVLFVRSGDKSAPVAIAYIDGHANLLPAVEAEEAIADSRAFFEGVKNAGDGPLPEAPGAPLPKARLPASKAKLPEDIRQALAENTTAASPIKLSWTRTGSSPLGHEEAMSRYYVEPYFFGKWTERAALDSGRMYSWSDGSRGGVYESANDGTNQYYISRGTQVQFGSRPLRGMSDLNQYSCTYLEWAGLRTVARPSALVKGESPATPVLSHPLIKQLADGAAMMAVEDATLEGRPVKKISIVAENVRYMRYLPETRDFTYYLDPQLHYALLRTDESYGERLIQRTDSGQLAQLGRGNAYLPKKIVRSFYNYKMVPDQFTTSPILTETLELTDVSTAAIPPEQFVLKPPPEATAINGRIIRRTEEKSKLVPTNGTAKSSGGEATATVSPRPAEDVLAGVHAAAPAASRPGGILPIVSVSVVIVALLALTKWVKKAR